MSLWLHLSTVSQDYVVLCQYQKQLSNKWQQVQEEIEALFISVRDVILARPNEDIAELAGLINNSPRRRRMHELELDDLQHLLQVSDLDLPFSSPSSPLAPLLPPTTHPIPDPTCDWLQLKGSSF